MLQIVLFHAEVHCINPGSSYLFPPAIMSKVSKLTNDKEDVESARNGVMTPVSESHHQYNSSIKYVQSSWRALAFSIGFTSK